MLATQSSVKDLLNFGVFSLFQTSREHVISVEQTVVPHHDYFSAQFLHQFSAQSIYHVTVSSSVIDSSGILWNTGPHNTLQVKTTDSASRKQRTSRFLLSVYMVIWLPTRSRLFSLQLLSLTLHPNTPGNTLLLHRRVNSLSSRFKL